VSRFSAPAGDAEEIEPVPAEHVHEIESLEELGGEAIIAQQTEAHLPQKRANVQDEVRSVVILEEPTASSRRPPPYRAERAEATLVMRDRRDLEAMRRKVLSGRLRAVGSRPYVWAGLAIAAFAAGGLVTLLLVRGAETPRVESASPASNPVSDHRPTERQSTPASQDSEPVTPQVKLEELPLEKPKRR
jgi:hypothetical protein